VSGVEDSLDGFCKQIEVAPENVGEEDDPLDRVLTNNLIDEDEEQMFSKTINIRKPFELSGIKS
jgi:hypothetical protein